MLSGSTLTTFCFPSIRALIRIRRLQILITTPGISFTCHPLRMDRPGERSQITRSPGCMSCFIISLLKPQQSCTCHPNGERLPDEDASARPNPASNICWSRSFRLLAVIGSYKPHPVIAQSPYLSAFVFSASPFRPLSLKREVERTEFSTDSCPPLSLCAR